MTMKSKIRLYSLAQNSELRNDYYYIQVTILLLRWHKALRSPIDAIDPSSVEAVEVVSNGAIRDPNLVAAGATGNSVSIMVMYRPKKPVKVRKKKETKKNLVKNLVKNFAIFIFNQPVMLF
jgi:hypothetical protein